MDICISELQIPRICIILDWDNDECGHALAMKWELAAMNSGGRLEQNRGIFNCHIKRKLLTNG